MTVDAALAGDESGSHYFHFKSALATLFSPAVILKKMRPICREWKDENEMMGSQSWHVKVL